MFSANATGSGIVNGHLLRINKITGQVIKYDTLTSAGNVLNFNDENYFLVLYGTGFRNRNTLSNVSLSVGGVSLPVVYAGAQGLAGLDQMNVQLPNTFTQRGPMNILWSVEGKAGNTVQVNLRNP